MTGLPLSVDNEMPPPGIRRRDFAALYTTRVSGAPDDFFASGDAKVDYQQYSDHIRATHYRNPVRLTTCTGCHNPHVNAEEVAEMDTSGNPNAVCTQCHMVPTARSGAAVTALLDPLGAPPTVQYYWNDVASHRMTVTRWEGGQPDQPIAFTNECGQCHAELLPNTPTP